MKTSTKKTRTKKVSTVKTKVEEKIKAALKSPLKNIKWATSKTKFLFPPTIQRSITPAHVTKLAKSISTMGILRPIICAEVDFFTGVKCLYVLDGQHCLSGCMRLDIEVPYIVIPIESKKELVESIALLNSSSKPWSMINYIDAWSTLVPDYVKLNRYFELYDFEVSVLAAILSNRPCGTGHMSSTLKKGEFRIKDEEKNVEILKNLTDVLNVVPRMNRFENKYLCSEYVNFVRTAKKYDHKRFIERLIKHKETFILATQQQSKLSDIFYELCK